MKKYIGIALAVLMVLGLATSVALADPPEVTLEWNLAGNPDIGVDSFVGDSSNYRASWFDLKGTGASFGNCTASANSSLEANFTASGTEINAGVQRLRQSSTSGYWQDSNCQFSLTGSSSVTGEISASTDWGEKYPGLNLEGSYTGFGSEADFSSSFSGYTLAWKGYYSTEYLSEHSITATGVNWMHVEGDANAYPHDNANIKGAGQTFSGEAERLKVEASRLTGDLNNPTGVQFTSTLIAGSTALFGGSTEDRYYQTDHHITGLVLPEGRSGGTPLENSNKYGLGFQIAATGCPCSIDNTFNSDYSYSVIRAFVEPDAEYPKPTVGVVGESATWSIVVGEDTYPDYPGYYDPES